MSFVLSLTVSKIKISSLISLTVGHYVLNSIKNISTSNEIVKKFTKLLISKVVRYISYNIDIISRVVFRTGMVERVLFDLLAKTKCQIVASVDDVSADDVGVMRRSKIWKAQANAFTWTLSVSSANAPNSPPDAPPSPTRSKRKTDDIVIAIKVNFKVGDDFLVNIPITGEKVNVSISVQKFF